MSDDEDWSGDVQAPASFRLKDREIERLFCMCCLLRDNIQIVEQVLEIKRAILSDDKTYARDLWGEMDDDEMIALNVAPTKGGIFTVNERKVLRNG